LKWLDRYEAVPRQTYQQLTEALRRCFEAEIPFDAFDAQIVAELCAIPFSEFDILLERTLDTPIVGRDRNHW
jgi:hypothetical protein